MKQQRLKVNQTTHTVECDPDTPLLWVLRDHLQMTGAKFGCGAGLCGACTVHVDGQATRSCVFPLRAVGDREVTTIEGLAGPGVQGSLHRCQQAFIDGDVPQCGYCHAGQIMAAAAVVDGSDKVTAEALENALNGVLCRCGSYPRIRAAIQRLTGPHA